MPNQIADVAAVLFMVLLVLFVVWILYRRIADRYVNGLMDAAVIYDLSQLPWQGYPTWDSNFSVQNVKALSVPLQRLEYGREIENYTTSWVYKVPDDPSPLTFAVLLTGGELESDQGVLAIRGTDPNAVFEWLIDGNYTLEECGEVCVHRGAWRITQPLYESLRPKLVELGITKLIVCGHSLGAIVSALIPLAVKQAGDNLSLLVYSFAQPRVGDPNYNKFFEDSVFAGFSLQNVQDVIVTLPPTSAPDFSDPSKPFRYDHAGKPYLFSTWRRGIDTHMLTTYSEGAESMVYIPTVYNYE